MKHQSRTAFALIEVLTVIAIIALLTGILLPVISRARMAGHRSVTVSDLRQIGLQLAMYEADTGSLPKDFDRLQQSGSAVASKMYLSSIDPFDAYGSKTQECFGKDTTVPTSYDHNLDWPEDMRTQLRSHDENHGIVAVRVYGDRTSYFDKAINDFCANGNFAFEGVLLRLRRDTSVQTARLGLHWDVHPGSSAVTPGFSVFDLYTDDFPSPFDD